MDDKPVMPTRSLLVPALLLVAMLAVTWTAILLVVPAEARDGATWLTITMLSVAEILTFFHTTRGNGQPQIAASIMLFLYVLAVAALTANGFMGAGFHHLLLYHAVSLIALFTGWAIVTAVTGREKGRNGWVKLLRMFFREKKIKARILELGVVCALRTGQFQMV